MKTETERYRVSRNACKLCTPLGACFAFKGIQGCMPLVHGSQGCSTYIRRYMISHYREPIDIASSNFSENTAIYGGLENLKTAIGNVYSQYAPLVIGVATTCLSETIGDDVAGLVAKMNAGLSVNDCELIHVSTPSYTGTHADGYRNACLSIAKHFARTAIRNETVTVIPGLFSPADIRHLKHLVQLFGINGLMLPDYSETLDGPLWGEYHRIPPGGTPVSCLKYIGGSRACMEFTSVGNGDSASGYLANACGVESKRLDYPIGIENTDRFVNELALLAGTGIPAEVGASRGRLLDAVVDG
ncbi:MAG: nitrogenase component 1, partial [Spirochaetota bacterium]